MGQFTHNGVVYEELPNGKVRPVAYANPLAGATPVGGADPMRPLQVQGAQNSLRKDEIDIQQGPLDTRNKQLSGQKTEQEIKLDNFKTGVSLKQQYDKDARVQTYRDAIPQVAGAMDAPNTPQGDISVVYAFAKVMDPASAVRGEEMDMARGSSPIAAQIQSYLGLLNSGKRLPPETRRGLIDAMRTKAQQYEAAYADAREEFQSVAQQGGFDPVSVIGEHDGANFRDIERKFSGQTKFANPQQFNSILSDMIEQGKPVAEIRQTLKEYGSTLPPYQEKILDQYEAVRMAGGSPQVRVDTMSGPSFNQGVAKGFKGAWDRAAVGLEGAYNAVVPQGMESNSATQAQQATQQHFQGVNTDPTGEMFGRLGGATLFSSPIRNPWAAGAAGNLLMTDSTGMEAVKDAGVGAIGGKVADVALRGGAQLLAPQLEQSVGNLAREGARLTPGRFFPGLKKTEDLARSYPIIGSKIDDALDTAENSINRIPPNRALGHIGQQLPADVPAGHAAVGHTERAIGDFYNQNLNGRSVGLDPTLITRLNYAGQRSPLRPQEFEQFNDIVQREVGGIFARGQGKASARDYKRLDSKLGKMANKLQSSADDPFKAQLGDHVEFLQEQMRHLMRRQNPDIADNLRKADTAWSEFVPYQRAASMDIKGIATPSNFKNAVRQNDSSLRKGAFARGEAKMQDFAIDASDVIPAERGNSGSADRLNLASLKAWGMGAAASPLYSDLSIAALNKLVKRDPDKASKAIADLMRLPHSRGMFGAIPYYGGVNSGSGY